MTPNPSDFLGLVVLGTSGDGIGQSMMASFRYRSRFRRLATRPVAWTTLTREHAALIENDPFIGRFADLVSGVAYIDGMKAIVMERLWSGFPDPPRYCLFVLAGEGVWAAADFDDWPPSWRLVGADGLEPPTLSV